MFRWLTNLFPRRRKRRKNKQTDSTIYPMY